MTEPVTPSAEAEPPPAPALRISRRRKIVFVSIIILVFVSIPLLAELVARVSMPPVRSIELFLRDVFPNLEQKAVGDKVFEGDPLLGWRLRPNLKNAFWDYTVFSTNSAGIRHDGPVGAKPKNGFRVLCMGDSVTFGYRVPVAFPEHPDQFDAQSVPYPELLERRLNAEHPDRPAEVLPLAVPGFTSRQGLAWLQRDIGRYEPDVVTICFGWNDVDLRAIPDNETLPIDWLHVSARRLCSASQLLAHLSVWYRNRKSPPADSPAVPGQPVPRTSKQDYVANILALAALAQKNKARPIIIAPVYRDSITNPPEADRIGEWRNALVAGAAQANIQCIVMPELTEDGAPANAALFGEVIHPNDAGHRLMAERIYPALLDVQ